MTSKLTRNIIQSEIADFFAGVVEIHTELGGPNTVEEAQNQLTDRVLACVPEVDSEPVGKPFMYGIADPDGNAYIDEFCVSEDLGLVEDAVNELNYDREEGDELNYSVVALYRHAQPAPVVPPMQHWEELCREYPDMSIGDAIIRAAWWNHCRAAMLNGGKP